MTFLNIPNVLTLIRLIGSPIILPFLFVYLLPAHIFWINGVLALFFMLISLTDFLDGYLARLYNQQTTWGKILDPIADKFLVYSALVALLAAHKIYFFWVIIFIGREMFIMGLRQVAMQQAVSLDVSVCAKWKTAFQMLFIAVVIANPDQTLGIHSYWNWLETGLLVAALVLSLYSAWQYYRQFVRALGLGNS